MKKNKHNISEDNELQLRLDKWLWAARFFKTRALASTAISGGKVHLDGKRLKPSKLVKVGDQLSITRGEERFEVQVLMIVSHRRPYKEACLMYQESEESLLKRELKHQQDKANGLLASGVKNVGRPNKKQRRQIHQFRHSD